MADPNFPDRPDHPDMRKLSKAAIANDTTADNGASAQEILAQLGITDPESIGYMAGQRVMRAVRHNFLSDDTRQLFMSIFIDGFCLGARFVKDEETP